VRHRLTEIGLFGSLVPEAGGGLGLDELDVLLCLEECGRAAVATPVVETVLVAPRLLAGTEHAARPATGWVATAGLDGSGLVPWADRSDAVLHRDADGRVRLLPLPDQAVAAVSAVDPERPVARVAGDAGRLLDVSPASVDLAWRAGVLGTSAVLLGLADRALELTVAYVRERHQFGVPVGSFQAVKHELADAHLGIELARPLVYTASWAHVHGTPTADRDVAAAKVRVGDVAGRVARAALQCHGGMGYTREYPLHRWLFRIWALQAAWGTGAQHRAALARHLGVRAADHGGSNV
jgi:alkylation response protein AidB-like acyl-CoA dehydrogenase